MKTIGDRIKELRLEKELTQKELAQNLNLTQDSISLWEKNKRIPDTIYIIMLCNFFKVSANYLLGLEDENGEKINIANSYKNIKNINNINNNSGNITIK